MTGDRPRTRRVIDVDKARQSGVVVYTNNREVVEGTVTIEAFATVLDMKSVHQQLEDDGLEENEIEDLIEKFLNDVDVLMFSKLLGRISKRG